MRRLIILAILISLASVDYSWSETPQQKIPPVSNKANDTTYIKQKSDNPQNITTGFPSTINLSVGGKLENDTAKNKDKSDKEPFKCTDWLLMIFNGLLVAVTVGLGCIAYHQLCTTRTTTRAYVRINSCPPGITFSDNAPILCTLQIRNFGETPAHVTDVVMKAEITPIGQLLPYPPDYTGATKYPCSNAFLVRNDSLSYRFTDKTLPTEELLSIESSVNTISLYGYVDYIDSFGKRHRGGFGQNYYAPNDDKGEGMSNLTFLMQHGYNYDRERVKGEGNDWYNQSLQSNTVRI
jgi:hypothetical protein